MAPAYLNEFHKRNSMACRKDLNSSAKSPLSVEDVLKQSQRFGRFTIRVISSGKAHSKKV